MISNNRLREILEKYRRGLLKVLGGDLESIALYGSQARGDAAEESDIDVLCIMKNPFDYGDLILRTGELSSAISLEYDVVLSTVFVTRSDYAHRKIPFLMNVRREAVAI